MDNNFILTMLPLQHIKILKSIYYIKYIEKISNHTLGKHRLSRLIFRGLGSPQAIKQAGKTRIEGAEYTVQDGDIMLIRFNV